MADAASASGAQQRQEPREGLRRGAGPHDPSEHTGSCWLVLADSAGREPRRAASASAGHGDSVEPTGCTGGLADVLGTRLERPAGNGDHRDQPGWLGADADGSTAASRRPWDSFDRLPCLDGKKRRVEPGTFPLAHGVSGRVGLLRGYGNAIVPQLAAEFVSACIEALSSGPLGGGGWGGSVAPATEKQYNDKSSDAMGGRA